MWKVFDRNDVSAVAEMDAFVRAHGNGHFMQLPSWAKVKKCWKWCGISVYREARLAATTGVLIRPLPLGLSLFYIPRGPVCSRNNRDIWMELMAALKQIARKHHGILLYTDPDEEDSNEAFRTIMRELGFRERTDNGFGNIQPQYVFRLDISAGSEDTIFRGFHPKTRYNIGLSQRKGVTVREYSGADSIPDCVLEDFSRLMEITGQRDCFRVRNLSYFRGLLDALQDDARILVAYLQDRPIGGAIEAFCGKKAWYLYGASANEGRGAMPNYLLQWTMIRRAMERKCEIYDFRGVPGDLSEKNPLYGLYRFKKGFGGRYTKFSGLFTYSFRPVCSSLLECAMRLRKKIHR